MDRMIRSIPAAATISGPGSSAVAMTPDYYVNDKSGGSPVVKKTILIKELYRKELKGPLKGPLHRVLLPVDEQNMGSTLNR